MNKYLHLSDPEIFDALDFAATYLGDIEEFIKLQIAKYEDIVESHSHGEWIHADMVHAEPPIEGIEAYLKLEVVEKYPNLLSSSLFISLFSFFESTLMEECRQNQAANGDTFSNEKDATLDKIKKYISVNLHSNYQLYGSKEWGEIKQYQIVRHRLAHADGNLIQLRKEEHRKSIEGLVKKNPYHISLLNFGEHVEILIRNGFCESFIVLVEKFIKDLNNAGRSA